MRSRKAKSGLRSLFGKAPDAATVADRFGKLAKRMLRDTFADAGWKDDRYIVRLAAHPAAPKAKLTVEPDGDISVKAVTAASVGPGYHAALVDVLDPVLDELDYEWAPSEVPDFIDHRDIGKLQDRFALDLADRLARRGEGQLRLSMPAHLAFRVDEPVLDRARPARRRMVREGDRRSARRRRRVRVVGPERRRRARASRARSSRCGSKVSVARAARRRRAQADARRRRRAARGAGRQSHARLAVGGLGRSSTTTSISTTRAPPSCASARAKRKRRSAIAGSTWRSRALGGWTIVLPGSFVSS